MTGHNGLLINSMRLSEKLKRLAKERGISVRALAQKMSDTSATTIGRWMKDDGEPSLSEAKELAKFFDVPLEFLADDDADEPPPPPLTEEERAILDQCRIFGLRREDAIRGLALAYAERHKCKSASVPARLIDAADLTDPEPPRGPKPARTEKGAEHDRS